MDRLRLCALYTGGKDSHYAIIKALSLGHSVECLLTVVPRRSDSYMFHWVNVLWTKLHSVSLGIPQIIVESSGEKEVELQDLKRGLGEAIRRYGVNAVLTGAVASTYQKERVDSIANELGIRHFSPLWGMRPKELLLEEVRSMNFIVVQVSAMGLKEELLGVEVDEGVAERLLELCDRHGISPVGEGGEFETFVLWSPIMKHRICIKDGEKFWHPSGWGYYLIKDATLC